MNKSVCFIRFQVCLQPSRKGSGIKPIKIKMKLEDRGRPFNNIPFVCAFCSDANVQSFMYSFSTRWPIKSLMYTQMLELKQN